MSAETVSADPAPILIKEPVTYLPPGAIPMSVETYLDAENGSEIRYEYVNGYAIPKDGVEILDNGEIRAMSGESAAHNQAAGNIYVKLDREIGDRPCTVYFENIRVRVSSTQYRYPDVAALCGDARFDNSNPPCLLNPSVLVEVLSPSTQQTDRREKFDEYRQMPTLTDYVLVAQDRLFVMHYARQSVSSWLLTEYTQPTDVLTFASLGVSLTLADIYRKIVFTA